MNKQHPIPEFANGLLRDAIAQPPLTTEQIDAMTIDEVFAANDAVIANSNYARRKRNEQPMTQAELTQHHDMVIMRQAVMDQQHGLTRLERDIDRAPERRRHV